MHICISLALCRTRAQTKNRKISISGGSAASKKYLKTTKKLSRATPEKIVSREQQAKIEQQIN